ncbi:carbon-nitrogen hydrolase family protein [Psychrobacter fulvigenes]
MVALLSLMVAARYYKKHADKNEFINVTFDLDKLAIERRQWGVFRDRRPSMYGTLLTHG